MKVTKHNTYKYLHYEKLFTCAYLLDNKIQIKTVKFHNDVFLIFIFIFNGSLLSGRVLLKGSSTQQPDSVNIHLLAKA